MQNCATNSSRKLAPQRQKLNKLQELYFLSLSLSLSMLYSPLNFCRFSRFLILYTVGRTPWTGDQPVARQLPTHRTVQTQNKRTKTSMPRLGLEPTTPVFERAKTVHALDRAATVIGFNVSHLQNKYLHGALDHPVSIQLRFRILEHTLPRGDSNMEVDLPLNSVPSAPQTKGVATPSQCVPRAYQSSLKKHERLRPAYRIMGTGKAQATW
jgi:hypothetical protein